MVEALVVQMRRRGPGQMLGLGDTLAQATGTVIDAATGGQLSQLGPEVARLELMLEVSIIASVVSGLAALAMLLRKGGR